MHRVAVSVVDVISGAKGDCVEGGSPTNITQVGGADTQQESFFRNYDYPAAVRGVR